MRPEPFFCGPGLDRADALRTNVEAVAELAGRAEARCLVWRDGLPSITEDGVLEWSGEGGRDLFLGLDGDVPCFSAIPETVEDTRAAFGAMSPLQDREAPLFAAAVALGRWHSRHLFCPACGSATEPARGGWSRGCGSCEAEHFPRVDPVVMMLAEHDGRVLLGRQPHYPPGRYSVLAGFLEVGESVEEAVRRELREEAGIDVADVSYVASQPWPFPWSLMIGCSARARSDRLVIDKTELEDARWFSKAEVESALSGHAEAPFQPPPRFAIARTLLERWVGAS